MKTILKTLGMAWLALIAMTSLSLAEGLKAYPGSTLVDHEFNDGDSFFVDIGDEQIHLRLYFVDAPESVVFADHDARRVNDQARYFGIEDREQVIALGKEAATFTREILEQPFTVYTAHARALGGSGSSRIYGFVVAANGRDLGELLVENGLARNFGVSRQNYEDIHHDEVESILRDLEIVATLNRTGAWALSNPELIIQYRAEQRAERQAMQRLMTSRVKALQDAIDVNTAEQSELEKIPGIGPVTAGRIIDGRPYASIDDLKKVPGIGAKTLERIAPFLSVQPVNG
ncbi:MAG: helix-hairpin-helix domain-containing protein [Kiritimatiellia bacterium]|jgi:competence ComEA-like helix-hairpin-helix protein